MDNTLVLTFLADFMIKKKKKKKKKARKVNLSDLLTLFFATQAFHIAIQNTQTVGPS